MEEIKVLIIDDDKKTCKQLVGLLNGKEISGCKILAEYESDFKTGKSRLRGGDYDVVILDVYRGKPSPESKDLPGKAMLTEIKEAAPVAVIFYTGLTTQVDELKSDVIRIVSKSTGKIGDELKSLIETGIPLIRKKLANHLREILKNYYWKFINEHTEFIRNASDKLLCEYLFVRMFAATLTKEGAAKIFGRSFTEDKVHPLEFYICPLDEESAYQTGDILKEEKNGTFCVVLTPSCDFFHDKADFIFLVSGTPLKETTEYINYKEKRSSSSREDLVKIIKSGKSERYFFLPRNELVGMPDLVLDFQRLTSFPIKEFNGYKKIARIDNPFCQDMLAMFVRYRNRPGSPDVDSDYILKYLDEELS